MKLISAIGCASRGRSKGEWHHSEHRQMLEINSDKFSNAISSVQKHWFMRTIKGISEVFNHAVEWQSKRWSDKRGVFPFSPALRATDYKCPKYVWLVVETD